MSRAMRKSLFGIVLLWAIAFCVLQARADDKVADKYTETGTVLSTADKHGHFYQVSTDSRIYLLLCDKVKSIQFGMPECKVGDKPIATGDTVHFRIEGDWAYMPPVSKAKPDAKAQTTAESEGMEEKLRILTTELKVIPPVPSDAGPSSGQVSSSGKTTTNAPAAASVHAVVIGSGLHVRGQSGAGWSTNPIAAGGPTTASPGTPVMATGPVLATPVTGGAPVMVTPVGPTTGGVVTGVPVTGGAPITAIPTGPVTGTPVGGAPAGGHVVMGGGAPQWLHVLRIQTATKVYQLEGSTKPGKLANKEIELGDTITLRTDKKEKHTYLSSDPYDPVAEQEYKILSVTAAPEPTAESKPN